ncbi:MAG: hypothetical protein HYV95_01580 [Opitutae bacterium]|nr:hypothetical protein [Opitutae bacterium]
MRRRLSLLCLCFAWLCANGALWDAVQVVAWGKMFATYSTYLSPAKALAKTFDGSKPCELCSVAQHGKDAARDAQSPATPGGNSERLLLAAEVASPLVLTAPDFSWPSAADDSGLIRAERVPVPPPRA